MSLLLENTIQWEIDFFPRGVRYNRAQLINVYNVSNQGKVEVPESILRTVRVRCTCKTRLNEEQRFKVSRIKFLMLMIAKKLVF